MIMEMGEQGGLGRAATSFCPPVKFVFVYKMQFAVLELNFGQVALWRSDGWCWSWERVLLPGARPAYCTPIPRRPPDNIYKSPEKGGWIRNIIFVLEIVCYGPGMVRYGRV